MDTAEPIAADGQVDSAQSWPSAPVFSWTSGPREVASAGVASTFTTPSNFFRSARWCHDGTSILTTAEDRIIRIHDMTTRGESLDPPRCFAQPDAIAATQWYPSASLNSSTTFCFMASVRDTPVRLIDAVDGRIRASYPIVDHRERYVSPHCIAFNPTATKAYCGHENAIEVLDIATPGHDMSERLKTISTKKESEGQRGIISSIAFCPDYSGTYAAGTFSGTVSIYSEDTGSTPLQHLEGVHQGGVTHLAFHPLSPTTLFVGSRRSSSIQVYDLRDVTAPLAEYDRKGSSNQRLWFEVDPWGRYLASGDEDGLVKVWDISDLSKTEPIMQRRLVDDAVGSVQLHPYKPLLLTTSGSRRLETSREYDSDTDGDSSDTSSEEEGSVLPPGLDRANALGSPPERATTHIALSRGHEDRRGSSDSLRIWSFA